MENSLHYYLNRKKHYVGFITRQPVNEFTTPIFQYEDHIIGPKTPKVPYYKDELGYFYLEPEAETLSGVKTDDEAKSVALRLIAKMRAAGLNIPSVMPTPQMIEAAKLMSNKDFAAMAEYFIAEEHERRKQQMVEDGLIESVDDYYEFMLAMLRREKSLFPDGKE